MHCTDEAQKAETVLSAVIYIYIYIYIYYEKKEYIYLADLMKTGSFPRILIGL